MTPDREQLELAAKAAGLPIHWELCGDAYSAWRNNGILWDPRTDDGDESRLEAALLLDVLWWIDYVEVCNRDASARAFEAFSDHNGDRQAARRAAGVRVAAEIGRKM